MIFYSMDEVREEQLPHFKANPWFYDQFNTKSIRHNLPDCHEIHLWTIHRSWGCRFWCPADCQLCKQMVCRHRSVKGTNLSKLKENEPIQNGQSPIADATVLGIWRISRLEFKSFTTIKAGLELLLNKWIQIEILSEIRYTKSYQFSTRKTYWDKLLWLPLSGVTTSLKQKELEKHITDYIRNLPGANTQLKALQFDSAVVLKSIEVQHGLLVERPGNLLVLPSDISWVFHQKLLAVLTRKD